MSNRDEIKRIAQAHADFYNDHVGKDMETFCRQYWSPDVKMYHGGRGEPSGLKEHLLWHSAERGFDWDKTGMEVQKLVVGDDSFVLQMFITQWRSHEADAVAAGDDTREAALPGYQNDAIPSVNIYTVGNDGLVERIDGYVFLSPELLAAGAARA